MSTKLKLLELSSFKKMYPESTASLYVINRTSNVKPHKAGRIVLTVTDDQNRPVAVVIPRTFIPVDLTTQAPLERLITSRQVRDYLNRGLIAIVDTADAVEYLTTNKQAQLEKSRIDKVSFVEEDLSDKFYDPSEHSAPASITTGQRIDTLSAYVRDFTVRYAEVDAAEKEQMRQKLLSRYDELSADDIAHLSTLDDDIADMLS